MSRASSLPWELTVAVEVLFASRTDHGVLLDCTLVHDVCVDGTVRIPAGAPFALEVGPDDHDRGVSTEALEVLRRWSDQSALVLATTSATDRRMVLRHDGDELVLQVG
jgi:hypothetical protein